jgi:hypothetical protein
VPAANLGDGARYKAGPSWGAILLVVILGFLAAYCS